MWNLIPYIAWVIPAVLVAWMIYDWVRTDRAYTEEQLTSSREGEIESLSEKHQIKG